MLKIKSIKPMYTKIVVTAERYTDNVSNGSLIVKTSGSVKEYLKVVAVGNMVKDIKVGDIVMINPARYLRKQYSDNSLREEFVDNPVINVNIPTVEINGEPHFLIDSGTDVEYVIDDYEEIPDSPKSQIIQPKPINIDKPTIVV